MPIPDYQTLMLPVLTLLRDGNCYSNIEMNKLLADKFGLSDEERNKTYEKENNNKIIFNDRIAWAKTYLKKAGLLYYPEKSISQITDEGITVLKDNPQRIDNKFLQRFDSYREFRNVENKDIENNNEGITDNIQTPDEMIAQAQILYSDNLQSDLLTKLKKVDPIRFERIVLQLMEKMNYGIGSMTKASHDGGIDGIIDEDELGLEKIYLQAKKYTDNKVNEKEMQNFAGALGCSTVRKGVFITTSFFDERAKNKAASVQGKIIRLIDGEELTKLMIKHNLGVQIKTKIEIKKIDEDFFMDED